MPELSLKELNLEASEVKPGDVLKLTVSAVNGDSVELDYSSAAVEPGEPVADEKPMDQMKPEDMMKMPTEKLRSKLPVANREE